MEENVALDSQKQKKFVKSIKGIKKLIQKSKEQEETRDLNDDENQEANKPFSMRLKNDKPTKRIRKPRGLVYLSHIPHGFYEHQMTQYFKQFGVVTNARVIRSKRTGNSKGYAFVEFKDPSVAEIVAETMNNYLMGKRLIKAAYIPPEKQRRAFRKRWSALNNPAQESRIKMKKAYNADKDESGNLEKAKKLLQNLNKTKKRLQEMGIDYDFFTPVDVPEQLTGQVVKQEKQDVNKKTSKEKKVTDKSNKVDDIKTKKETVESKKQSKQEIKNKKVTVTEVPVKGNKKDKVPVNVNKQDQKQKKQTLKEAGGAKTLEEFIKLDEADDSDSSADFDSDEYEKALENEDDSDGSLGDSESEDEDDESEDDDDDDQEEDEEESEEEEEPPKKAKGRAPPVSRAAMQPNKQGNRQQQQPEVKRKAPQRSAGSPKKPKFEKQSQKPMKKQFKRK